MSTLAASVGPARERAGSRLAYQATVAIAASLFVALSAQISLKLPITPVPFTGQTLAVLVVGAALGPELGAVSLLLYLAEGAAGLHFFAGGGHGVAVLTSLSSAHFTGGYLWGFVAASAVVGWLSRRGWDRSIRSAIGAMLIGEIVIYAFGVPWLMGSLDLPAAKGLEYGLYPFVVSDTLKLLVAAGLLPGAWRLVGRGGTGEPGEAG